MSVTVFFSTRKLQHINIVKAIFPFCILAPDFDTGEHTKLILTKGSAQSNRGEDIYRHAGLEQVMRRHVAHRYQLLGVTYELIGAILSDHTYIDTTNLWVLCAPTYIITASRPALIF